MSATAFVGYCVGNVVGPVIFGASPGPLYRAGFVGSFVCLCGVVGIAGGTGALLWRENARREREGEMGARRGGHAIEEDLTDWQNEEFRYVL